MSIKRSPCYIKEAKCFIGSAIRICKDICRPDLADKFNEIVEGSFTPDEHQDIEDPSRGFFVAEGS
jgi:hypothetical protein